MKNIRFFNCPACDKPTFIKADDDVSDGMKCEHCGHAFSVATDTRPFIMCTHIDDNTVYAC